MAQVYQGIFPDAIEVKKEMDKNDFDESYLVIFDPQKCLMTPENWDMVSKLGHKIVMMTLNTATNQMEVQIR